MYQSFVNLYLALCQPSAFSAETYYLSPGARLVFMIRMTSPILAAQMVIGGLIVLIAQLFQVDTNWWPKGLELAVLSLLMGWGWALIWNVTFAISWATVWGLSAWTVGNVILPAVCGPGGCGGTGGAIQICVPLALASGVGLGAAVRTQTGVVWGMAAWLGVGAWVAPDWRMPVMGILFAAFVIGYFRGEWYHIDAVATRWQLALARRAPKHAREYLRKSPIYWREPIWLTLPGLRSFLRLVGAQDFRAGIEECLFVIYSRPSQARTARLALMEIMASHLGDLNTVEEIAAMAGELGHATAEQVTLPGPLEEALPGLEQLAQHAEQHITAILPHNRRRALERLRDGADDLATRLALSRDSISRLLIGVATRWRDAAEAELQEMGEEEADANYIHNPFIFGQPIEETETNLFVGRRDTVTEIEISLLGGAQKPALVLWGPRRMGKTSVLLQLPRLLGPEFVPTFVDVQSVQVRESLPAFLHSLTAASGHALRRRGLMVQALPVSDLGENPFTAFSEWLERVETALAHEKHLLLCLDEFERLDATIREGHLPKELMDEIRHIIQHHPRIVLLFAGSHRPDELELNWPDALISTKMIHVSYLVAEEVRQLITHPVPEFPVTYEEGSVARIIEITRCQPYLVQAVCYELVNHLNLEGRREATVADVEAGIQRALESAHLYFAEMWRQFPEPYRALLRLLASHPDGLETAELARAAQTSPELLALDLKRLESRSTLEQVSDTGRWRYQVPLVAAWVERQGG
jgi:hypothetical protein